MLNRRDFLKQAALVTASSGLLAHEATAHSHAPHLFHINKLIGSHPRMALRFFPYELQLRHVFTVATYSRSTKTWKKGKTYYFHIRTYSKVNGVKKYSSYKTVKVKMK